MSILKGRAIYKVPEGKLLRLEAEFEGDRIAAIWIKGDFFMHPEAGVEKIEQALAGKEIGEGLVGVVNAAVKKNGIEMFGLNAEAVVEAIRMARGNAK